jgi:hypothetical protein
MRVPIPPRTVLAVLLLLFLSCTTSAERMRPEGRRQAEPGAVRASELPGGARKLSFEPMAPDLAVERLRVEEARTVLAAFHEFFRLAQRPRARNRLVRVSAGAGEGVPAQWEQRLREEYVSRFGPPLLAMPQSLEQSRLYLALRLSPRYMGAGVREAAQELFSSPVFLTSVALSVGVYFAAWLAPEPLFTKAFVVGLTVRLAFLVGALELTQVAQACLRLYQEAEVARTVEELEAVAERFGKAMGGTALRVLMVVASMGLAKALPQVPEGGVGALLGSPRYAMAGGELVMEGATTVQMVADGSIIVTGVAAGTAASSSALGSACTDGSEKRAGHHWHHLATNKNDISTVSGGPWTPLFEKLFARAGMNLDAAENLVYLKGHKGPHPEEYHQAVYTRLEDALGRCQTVEQCRTSLRAELKRLVDEVCTPGSWLHRLTTKS